MAKTTYTGTAGERTAHAREMKRERSARKYETDEEKTARFQEMSAEDQLTQVTEFVDGRKRYSLHLKEYNGAAYLAIKKQAFNPKNGQWYHKQLLTFAPEDAADMLEMVAKAASIAAEIAPEEAEEVA